jgi:hypothetical protein
VKSAIGLSLLDNIKSNSHLENVRVSGEHFVYSSNSWLHPTFLISSTLEMFLLCCCIFDQD